MAVPLRQTSSNVRLRSERELQDDVPVAPSRLIYALYAARHIRQLLRDAEANYGLLCRLSVPDADDSRLEHSMVRNQELFALALDPRRDDVDFLNDTTMAVDLDLVADSIGLVQ